MPNKRTITIANAGLRTICRSRLTKTQNTILWYLLRKLPEAGSTLSHVKLAAKLSIHNIQVGNALRHLTALNLIIRSPRKGINHHYSLNAKYFKIGIENTSQGDSHGAD